LHSLITQLHGCQYAAAHGVMMESRPGVNLATLLDPLRHHMFLLYGVGRC